MPNDYSNMPKNAAWAAASSPYFQANDMRQKMEGLQRDYQNAQIGGADPYRMAELGNQLDSAKSQQMRWLMQQFDPRRNRDAGSVSSIGQGGRPNPSIAGNQDYLMQMLQMILGGGMGGGGQRSGPMR